MSDQFKSLRERIAETRNPFVRENHRDRSTFGAARTIFTRVADDYMRDLSAHVDGMREIERDVDPYWKKLDIRQRNKVVDSLLALLKPSCTANGEKAECVESANPAARGMCITHPGRPLNECRNATDRPTHWSCSGCAECKPREERPSQDAMRPNKWVCVRCGADDVPGSHVTSDERHESSLSSVDNCGGMMISVPRDERNSGNSGAESTALQNRDKHPVRGTLRDDLEAMRSAPMLETWTPIVERLLTRIVDALGERGQ